MLGKVLKLLEENEVVCFARFEYKECRTKIPYLKKLENGYMAVYPHLSAYPKENEALIMKVNQMILSHCGVDIVENRIVYLNKEYVRQYALDLNELLCISDKLFNKRNHLSKTIAEWLHKSCCPRRSRHRRVYPLRRHHESRWCPLQ